MEKVEQIPKHSAPSLWALGQQDLACLSDGLPLLTVSLVPLRVF